MECIAYCVLQGNSKRGTITCGLCWPPSHSECGQLNYPKVMHLIYSLGGGGAERQVSYLTSHMAASGWPVRLVYCRSGSNEARINGVDPSVLHRLPSTSSYSFRNVLGAHRIVRQWKPDVIQTWLPMMDVVGGMLAKIHGVPHIVSERTEPGRFSRDTLRRRIGAQAAAVVCNSHGGCAYWSKHVDLNRLHLIRNGLPLEEIKHASLLDRQSIGLSHDDEIILFVGRLASPKNLQVMLAGVERVLDQREQAVFVMLGDGPLRSEINAQVSTSPHCDRIHVMGFCSNAWSWMREACAVVAVSHFEGDPNVAMEAAACGCPLVLSDIKAYRDVLGNGAAEFVDKDDPASICNGLFNVLSGGTVVKDCVDRARRVSAERSISAMVDAYMGIYREVCG